MIASLHGYDITDDKLANIHAPWLSVAAVHLYLLVHYFIHQVEPLSVLMILTNGLHECREEYTGEYHEGLDDGRHMTASKHRRNQVGTRRPNQVDHIVIVKLARQFSPPERFNLRDRNVVLAEVSSTPCQICHVANNARLGVRVYQLAQTLNIVDSSQYVQRSATFTVIISTPVVYLVEEQGKLLRLNPKDTLAIVFFRAIKL